MSRRWLLVLGLALGACHKRVDTMAIGVPPEAEYTPAVAPVQPQGAPQATLAPAPVELGAVHFATASATIRSADASVLEANLATLREQPELQVVVAGYCDERGSDAYNLALGQRRASAVKRWLVARGIEAARITTISYGEADPVDPGHDEAAWAQNRRVTTTSARTVAEAR